MVLRDVAGADGLHPVGHVDALTRELCSLGRAEVDARRQRRVDRRRSPAALRSAAACRDSRAPSRRRPWRWPPSPSATHRRTAWCSREPTLLPRWIADAHLAVELHHVRGDRRVREPRRRTFAAAEITSTASALAMFRTLSVIALTSSREYIGAEATTSSGTQTAQGTRSRAWKKSWYQRLARRSGTIRGLPMADRTGTADLEQSRRQIARRRNSHNTRHGFNEQPASQQDRRRIRTRRTHPRRRPRFSPAATTHRAKACSLGR